MRILFALSMLLLPSLSLAQQHTPIPKGKQCFALLGEERAPPGVATMSPSTVPGRGSVLMSFEENGTVRLYFKRSIDPYNAALSGKPFSEVARSMIDRGNRPITQMDRWLSFDHGTADPSNEQTYQVTIGPDGGPLGRAISRNGQFSVTKPLCQSKIG